MGAGYRSRTLIPGLALLLLLAGRAVAWAGEPVATVDQARGLVVEGRQVDVLGVSMHYRHFSSSGTAGGGAEASVNVSAPPLLLLHGLGGSSAMWFKTAPDLARAGFEVYAPDFPGFGSSEVPPEKVSVLDLPRYLTAFMDAVGLDRVSVIGNSMGGYAAWLLASEYPNRVAKLVLVDSAGLPLPDPLPNTLKRLRPWYLDLPGAEAIGRSIEKVLQLPEADKLTRDIVRPYIEQIFADPAHIPEDVFDMLHESFKESRIVFLGRLEFPTPAPDYARRLSSITAPTLVMWGEEDALLPVTDGSQFALLIPCAELRVYPKLGHVPMLEDPEAFLTDLRRFLSQ